MKILTGALRARTIDMPEDIRPTQQKVRKAIFDILSERIKGAIFLDLFAGSGAVGIEALSNGASEVIFVENNRKCIKILENNLAKLWLAQNYRIESNDASLAVIGDFKRENKRFDLIFLDPPYYKPCLKLHSHKANHQAYRKEIARENSSFSIAKKTLINISSYDILKPNSFTIIQHHKQDKLPNSLPNLSLYKNYNYRDNQLTIYERK